MQLLHRRKIGKSDIGILAPRVKISLILCFINWTACIKWLCSFRKWSSVVHLSHFSRTGHTRLCLWTLSNKCLMLRMAMFYRVGSHSFIVCSSIWFLHVVIIVILHFRKPITIPLLSSATVLLLYFDGDFVILWRFACWMVIL